MSWSIRKVSAIAVSVASALAAGFLTATFNPSAASAAGPVTSIPIDVAFRSNSGTAQVLTQDQYTQVMTDSAKWWTTQAQGLLGPVNPTPGPNSYGVFTWTPYSQIKLVTTSQACIQTSGYDGWMEAGIAAWGTGYGTYGPITGNGRRLLVFGTNAECSSATAAGLTHLGPNSIPSFPGSGVIEAMLWPTTGNPIDSLTNTLIHEMGHTFGLEHALSAFVCTGGLDGKTYGHNPEEIGTAPCIGYLMSSSSNNDVTNVMGAGTYLNTGLDGYQKEALGIVRPGAGLAQVTTPGTTSFTLTPGKTTSTSAVQAVHVTDSAASPQADYIVDFPATTGTNTYPTAKTCTVRVERPIPPTGWTGIFTPSLLQAANIGNADTVLVATPRLGADPKFPFNYPAATEMCLTTGDAYTSWSGNVTIKVTGVAADKSTATVQVSYSTPATATFTNTKASINTTGPNGVVTSTVAATPTPDRWDYQWLRDGQPIPGATDNTYTLVTADQLHTISLAATPYKTGYISQPVISAGSFINGRFAIPIVRIPTSGSIGQTIAATVTCSPTADRIDYEWIRNGTTVAGATGPTYTLTTADAGAQIRVLAGCNKLTYSRSANFSNFLTVSTTPQQFSDVPVVRLPATGSVGQTITPTVTCTPAPDSMDYLWYRDSTWIPGQTAATYTITAADAGHQVRVLATCYKAGYSSWGNWSNFLTVTNP